jgi:hypothetical protein
MKIDNNMLDILRGLPDDKLWQMIKVICSARGVRLPEETNDKKTMALIRKVLNNATAEDVNHVIDMYVSSKDAKR